VTAAANSQNNVADLHEDPGEADFMVRTRFGPKMVSTPVCVPSGLCLPVGGSAGGFQDSFCDSKAISYVMTDDFFTIVGAGTGDIGCPTLIEDGPYQARRGLQT